MENKKREIAEFYKQIFSDQKLKEKIVETAKKITNEEDLRKLIREEIMPIMKKFKGSFSEEELLEYEEETLKELSAEGLENVSGGVSIKSALLTGTTLSLMVLGGIGLSPANVHADNPVKHAQGQGQKSKKDNNNNANNMNNNSNDNDNANNNANDNVNNSNDNDKQIDINDLGINYGDFFDDFEDNQINNSYYNYHGVHEDVKPASDIYRDNKNRNNLFTDGTNVFAAEPTSNLNEVKVIRAFAANNAETLVIPPTLTNKNGQKVTVVEIGLTGEHHMPNIRKIVISENEKLKSVKFDSNLFRYGCENLESVEILQKSVDIFTIGRNSFLGCPNLKTFVMPQEVKEKFSVAKNVFENCALLKKVFLPRSAKDCEIWERAFYNCSSLEEIVIPQDAQRCMIKDNAFYNCSNLRKVVMPQSTEIFYILDNAFEECINLKKLIMPTNIKKAVIGKFAFLHTGLNILNINADEISIDNTGIPIIYKDTTYQANEKFNNKIRRANNKTTKVNASPANVNNSKSTKNSSSDSDLEIRRLRAEIDRLNAELTARTSGRDSRLDTSSRNDGTEDNAGPKLITRSNRAESSSSSAAENDNANINPNEGQSIFTKIKSWGSAFASWIWRAITFWR